VIDDLSESSIDPIAVSPDAELPEWLKNSFDETTIENTTKLVPNIKKEKKATK
jgi:hypothetical protein